MKPYPKYKDSEVEWIGEIPVNWNLKRLKYLIWLISEKCKEECDVILSLENIQSGTGRLINLESKKNLEGELIQFRINDVLFNKLRPYLAKVYLAKNDGACVSELLVLRSNNELLPNFLFYRLISADFIRIVDSSTYGSKMPRASWEDFISLLPMAYPDISEQLTITKYLDSKLFQIENLINKKKLLIDLLQEEKTAIINEAVTKGLNPDVKMKDSGIPWLGEIPEHWRKIKMKYLVKYVKGYAFKTELFQQDGIPIVKASDIKNHSIIKGKDYISADLAYQFETVKLNYGDIIISTVGSTPDVLNSAVGQVAKIPFDLGIALLNQNTVKFFSVDEFKLCNDFLFYYLISFAYRKYLNLYAHGTANQASLNIEDMLDFDIALPKYEDQKEIITYLNKSVKRISKAITKIMKEIELLNEYRTTLISEAVTGKIDVRGFGASEEV